MDSKRGSKRFGALQNDVVQLIMTWAHSSLTWIGECTRQTFSGKQELIFIGQAYKQRKHPTEPRLIVKCGWRKYSPGTAPVRAEEGLRILS